MRRRLVISTIAIVLVVLGTLAVPVGVIVYTVAEQQIDINLQKQADAINRMIRTGDTPDYGQVARFVLGDDDGMRLVDDVDQEVLFETGGQPPGARAITRIVAVWEECLAASGGPYLFGESFGNADFFYAPVVSRFHSYDVALSGAAKAYADRVWHHPFMREWLKAAAQEVADGVV